MRGKLDRVAGEQRIKRQSWPHWLERTTGNVGAQYVWTDGPMKGELYIPLVHDLLAEDWISEDRMPIVFETILRSATSGGFEPSDFAAGGRCPSPPSISFDSPSEERWRRILGLLGKAVRVRIEVIT